MDYAKYLKKKYQAEEIIEINKNDFSINWIFSIQRIIGRFERRTTLYGQNVMMLHEMAFDSKGNLVPKYFGPEIKKKNNNKNWVGCICFYALIVTFTQEETNYQNIDEVPFIDRINEPPIENFYLDLDFEICQDNQDEQDNLNESEEKTKYVIPAKRNLNLENNENGGNIKTKEEHKPKSYYRRKKKKKDKKIKINS